jgi:hypothetical protein
MLLDCSIHVCHIGAKPTNINGMCCGTKVTTPFVRRAVLALPPYRSVDLLSIVETENLPRFKQWMKVTSTCTRQSQLCWCCQVILMLTTWYCYMRRLFSTARATRRLARLMKTWSRAWATL